MKLKLANNIDNKGIQSQIDSFQYTKNLTHNQVVLGSSPSGPTLRKPW